MASAGCERTQPTSGSAGRTADQVEPSVPKPDYAFVAGLEQEYPEVVAFLRHFMETALAGDYAGYRRLVSRRADPESRTRFEKILNSLASLTIEEIRELDLPQLADQCYLVTSRVRFLPQRQVALRRGNNSPVAILVFEEEGEWRMCPAPPELQPPIEQTAEPATSTSAPAYPWQADGDY